MRILRVVAAGWLLTVAGCSAGTTGAGEPDPEQTLTVLAAASLTETFTDLAEVYEREHPGVDVRLAFDSSAALAGQVVEGAPADVLATADARTMRTVTDAGATAAEPQRFATNTMVLVVPAGNPAGITGFDSLDQSTFVTCVASAPCGRLAASLLEHHQVTAAPSSLEVDVKAVLTKVALDEADAGLVYATDAASAGDRVETVAGHDAADAVTSYLVAPLRQSDQAPLARDWVELLVSAEGQAVLRRAGFGRP